MIPQLIASHAARTCAVVLALAANTASAHAQARRAVSEPVPPGSFIGGDSLDARKEPGTPSRVRHQLRGAATWTIERDTLDLRPKFTIRIALPEPSAVVVVIRAVDSLPPAPGRYTFFLAASGASHSRRQQVNASVQAREDSHDVSYLPINDALVITSTRTEAGVPIVSGTLRLEAERYERTTKGPIHDYVWLNIQGDFTAVPAREPRPVVVVTKEMQQDVLERALLGFGITAMGAINGDGDVDSTHSPTLGRAFLESRWSDAMVVEHIEATAGSFRVRLRGRFVPVVCEQAPTDQDAECTTLPTAVTEHGAGSVSGTMRGMVPHARGGEAVPVYLVPNPVPIRDAFAALCAKRFTRDSAEGGALDAMTRRMSERQLDSAMQALQFAMIAREDRENENLISGVAAKRASTGVGEPFAFSNIPAGNYLLMARQHVDSFPRHWFVPVVVRPGSRISLDLDGGNVSSSPWVCDVPLPFPMIHERKR